MEQDTQKVLIVDDDLNLLAGLKRTLGRKFDMQMASGGREALDVLEEYGPFALIVTDLSMPGMNGIDLLAKVQEISPDTVRMMMTSFSDSISVMNAVNTGYIYRFLTKPCQSHVLEMAVYDGLEQYRRAFAQKELYGLSRVHSALTKVIYAFIRLVEARDPYTSGHQKRVAKLATEIASKMQLSREQTECVRLAALIHDIGKVYVPAEFLNKPGKLSSVEFNVIKSHPEVAYEVLKPLDFEWPISEVVLQHHERLDGSGYPRGLKGDQIVLEARIIAVADVVEAINSHRPYRPAHGLDKALDEIVSNKGRFYDSVVVEQCEKIFEDPNWSFE